MRLVFMGTPEPAVASLERLVADGHDVVEVWTQPDRPSGRGKRLAPPPVKQAALRLGIPVFQPPKIKNEAALERFRSSEAEAAVVVAYGKILPGSFLEAFPKGCINVHYSLLPRFRGAAPVNWAIVRGETVSGVTTMQMDEGLDTGDILLQKEIVIGDRETAPELMQRLSSLGADLISETLARLDSIVPVKQDDAKASYAPMMSKDDGRIDWSNTSDEISRRVRGFQPFPKSYGTLAGSKITLWECENVSADSSKEPEGTVIRADSGELEVACGGGTVLRLLELQQEGKKRMSARDFLNGTRIRRGDRFEG